MTPPILTDNATMSEFTTFLARAINEARDAIDVDFNIVQLCLYGSLVQGKPNPNDIDVFVQVQVNSDSARAADLGFEFDEHLASADPGSDLEFQTASFIAEQLHEVLHGALYHLPQPNFSGMLVDICVSIRPFADYWSCDHVCIPITLQS